MTVFTFSTFHLMAVHSPAFNVEGSAQNWITGVGGPVEVGVSTTVVVGVGVSTVVVGGGVSTLAVGTVGVSRVVDITVEVVTAGISRTTLTVTGSDLISSPVDAYATTWSVWRPSD